jgi:hypothetical protein
LTARGLTGTQLVISDDHPGVVDAIEATLVGAGWQPLPHPLFEEPVDQVPKSSETMAATRKPSSLNPTRTPYGPSFAVSSTTLDRSDWSPPPSPRPCRSGDSDIHRVPQTALATDLVQQLPRTVEQRIQKMHKCCRHLSTRSRSFVSSGRFLSNNTLRGHRPALDEPREPRPNPHQTHRQPTKRTHRGGDPRSRTSNRLERNLQGRRGITHTPRHWT